MNSHEDATAMNFKCHYYQPSCYKNQKPLAKNGSASKICMLGTFLCRARLTLSMDVLLEAKMSILVPSSVFTQGDLSVAEEVGHDHMCLHNGISALF